MPSPVSVVGTRRVACARHNPAHNGSRGRLGRHPRRHAGRLDAATTMPPCGSRDGAGCCSPWSSWSLVACQSPRPLCPLTCLLRSVTGRPSRCRRLPRVRRGRMSSPPYGRTTPLPCTGGVQSRSSASWAAALTLDAVVAETPIRRTRDDGAEVAGREGGQLQLRSGPEGRHRRVSRCRGRSF